MFGSGILEIAATKTIDLEISLFELKFQVKQNSLLKHHLTRGVIVDNSRAKV